MHVDEDEVSVKFRNSKLEEFLDKLHKQHLKDVMCGNVEVIYGGEDED